MTPTPGRSSGKQEVLFHERSLPILIEKWESEMVVVVSAGIMDNGQEIAKTVSSVVVHSISEKISVFNLRQANVETASHLPNWNMAILGVTSNENTEKTQAFYMTLLIQGKMTKALADSGSNVSLFIWSFLNTLVSVENWKTTS